MKRDYCDMMTHEREKLNFTGVNVHITAYGTKQTKFDSYQGPCVKIFQLSQSQYEKL
jgi:hypothetical protein